MASRAEILQFLSGGIAAIAPPSGGDGPEPVQGTAESPPQRPEETPPEPQLKQTEAILAQATRPQVLLGAVLFTALVVALAFGRR